MINKVDFNKKRLKHVRTRWERGRGKTPEVYSVCSAALLDVEPKKI